MKVVIFLIVIFIAYIFVTINKLIKLKNKVKEAFSTMDVYLKKRWDLVPNLVEIVKGYAQYEENTFKKIAELRTPKYDGLTEEQKIDNSIELKESIIKIIAIAEDYPELKANENFSSLSAQLITIENEIANSRKYYNAYVREYNNKVEMFPSSIIAGIFGYKTMKMFEADLNEKENINIDYTKEEK